MSLMNLALAEEADIEIAIRNVRVQAEWFKLAEPKVKEVATTAVVQTLFAARQAKKTPDSRRVLRIQKEFDVSVEEVRAVFGSKDSDEKESPFSQITNGWVGLSDEDLLALCELIAWLEPKEAKKLGEGMLEFMRAMPDARQPNREMLRWCGIEF